MPPNFRNRPKRPRWVNFGPSSSFTTKSLQIWHPSEAEVNQGRQIAPYWTSIRPPGGGIELPWKVTVFAAASYVQPFEAP
jgi:hypothetical protein